MAVSAIQLLVAILLVYVVVLNMVLSNMMYNQRFRHNASGAQPEHLQPVLARGLDIAAPRPHAPGLLVLVLMRSSKSSAEAPVPLVAGLMMKLRSVAWQTPPRIVLVMERAMAMHSYNDWCLLTELQCDIAVLGDMSAAGLVHFIYNTDMCCTRAGVPTRDVLLLYEGTHIRRGLAQQVARLERDAVTCLQGSPCQAYYIPAAFLVTNTSRWSA